MLNNIVWDFWAEKYDRLWVQKYSLGPTRKAILKVLRQILNKNKKYRILDMGCGTGQLLRELQEHLYDFDIEYTGVDLSAKMIEICREKDSKTNYIVSSIEKFEGLKENFDIIICSHSFPYYKDKAKTIEQFHSMLKKEGMLFLVQASANSIYDNIAMFFVKFTTGKAQYLSISSILNLVKNKFKKIDIIKIKEKFYMPTICLFSLKKEGWNENSSCKTTTS